MQFKFQLFITNVKVSDTDSIGLILLVDDEENIAELLKYNLEAERYSIKIVTKAAAVAGIDLFDCRLVIADAMSQAYTGMDLLRDLKANPVTAHIPFIILSSNDSEETIVDALDAGADDYLLKPFSLRELVARIRAVFRRHPVQARPMATATTLRLGTLRVDQLTRTVTDASGRPLPLTPTEYLILAFLLKNKNRFFRRIQIYDEVWHNADAPVNDRVVDTNISRLRKKLGDAALCLVNRTGQGYAIID